MDLLAQYSPSLYVLPLMLLAALRTINLCKTLCLSLCEGGIIHVFPS